MRIVIELLRRSDSQSPPRRRHSLIGTVTSALVAIALSAAADRVARAGDSDPTLVCPSASSGEPYFEYPKFGLRSPIFEPLLKAVAVKACSASPTGADAAPVNIVNNRPVAIFVGFTTIDHKPGPIKWGAGCKTSGAGAKIEAGATCAAKVASSGVATRFCATLNQTPADCFNAQANRQTMAETNFEPASHGGCFNQGACVWYDISVIPTSCIDALWKRNQCANTGGASYNLPVSLGCSGATTYACAGPATSKFGSGYPANCGDPDAICSGGPKCLNAHFYPMFDPPESKYQPNSVCLGGRTLTITFLAGK